jgi:hypothetical protein
MVLAHFGMPGQSNLADDLLRVDNTTPKDSMLTSEVLSSAEAAASILSKSPSNGGVY